MRQLIAATVGLLTASVLLAESASLNGSQAPQPLPPDSLQPQSPNPQFDPNQTPPETRPQPVMPRRGFRPRFGRNPGMPPAGPNTMPNVAPDAGPRAVRTPPQAAPLRPLQSVFLVPAGLSMPAEDLFLDLGYGPVTSIPLTPRTSFDVAYKCYAHGLYADAIAFARHGLTMCDDARLHLLKGDCELQLGLRAQAEKTASDFRAALAQQQFYGIESARERINDEMATRFDDIVEYQDTGR
jgi:hypothetical protein